MAMTEGKGGKMGYAGSISNAGTQEVKAPCAVSAKTASGKVKKGGGDLRSGGK